MPRFAVVDNGFVVGVLSAPAAPTIDVPVGRIFVEIEDSMDLTGGGGYDPVAKMFILPPSFPTEPPVIIVPEIVTLEKRVAVIEGILGIGVIQPPALP